MKAALYHRFGGPITIERVPDPKPAPHGVVIQVMASGLCLSDWHGWMGHDPDIQLPHVPGHELAGAIAATGREVRNFRVGQRVTVPFVGGCGSCVYCREGNQQLCDHQFQPGFTAWGSFAEYVAINHADENLVELPEGLDFISAASLGCRFVTAFRAVADQARIQPGQWLAIHGCGGVGLSAIQIGKALGARVIAVDITEAKCLMAASLGAESVINGRTANVTDAIRELSGGGVHASIDALGHPETFRNSIHSLRKGGKHLQVGLMPANGGKAEVPMARVIAHELQLIGSHGMQAHRYAAMFRFIRDSGIDLAHIVRETIDLTQAAELLPIMNSDPSAGIRVLKF